MSLPNNSPLNNSTSKSFKDYLEIPIVQFLIFIGVTFLYFLGVYKFFGIDFEKLKALEPNALGDFLAGTFAPLGFILLILGYMVNTRALKMQAEELKNSVDEQRALVQTAKDELDFLASQHQQNRIDLSTQLANQQLKDEINALPIIQFRYLGGFTRYEVSNIGAPVINIKLIKIDSIISMTSLITVLKTSSIADELKVDIEANRDKEFSFKIIFTTALGIEYEQIFKNQILPHNQSVYAIFAQGAPTKVDVVDC